jgi:hypothetical protein
MNRVCVHKVTGKLIEMQAGGDDREDLMEMRLNTLKQNATNAGYAEEDVEVRWATQEETDALMAPGPEEVKAQEETATKAKLREIDIKSIRSMREMLAKLPDAPKYLLDCEAMATLERVKLNPVPQDIKEEPIEEETP